jgi:hypothetical protein
MSMRPGRKLHNLNVWQRGIQNYRAAQRPSGGSTEPTAHGGWAKAIFRRLLGRRAATAKGGGKAPGIYLAAGGGAAASGSLAAPKLGARPEIDEGMLSRRVVSATSLASPPRMTQVGPINVGATRDLRFWQRGKEFVAAACGGFDTGAGPAHAAERRAFWRQRSRRPAAATARSSVAKATQSLRLLLRALAKGSTRDEVGQVAPGHIAAVGSRKATKKATPQPVAAAAGARRVKSFRDHKFRQQGLALLEKALRTKKAHSPRSKAALAMYRPPAGWLPGGASKSLDSPGPATGQQG